MIKHYFKISIRKLRKQKTLTFINVIGLSIGMACFCLFLLFAVNAFSFDRFHINSDNIYRVYRWTEAMNGNDANGDSYMPMPLGPAMKEELPDVKNYVRFQEGWGESFIKSDGNVSRMEVSFADPQIFNVFTFPIVSGNKKDPLKELQNIVLTEKISHQLFGNENPVGKTIEIKLEDSFEPFIISAIVKDIPANSTIEFKIMGNYEYLAGTSSGKRSVDNWRRSSYQTYVELKEGSTLAENPALLLNFRQSHYPDEEKRLREQGRWKGKGAPVTYGLQPLSSIHTDTRVGGGSVSSISPKNIWILLAIASGVLLIACINFTTLSIGRSAGSTKEVGIRKVIGSLRKQLVYQFMAESILLSVISTLIGLCIAYLLLPSFNQLANQQLSFSFALYPELIWLIILVTIITGILAGSYPALVLSSYKPIEVLKNKIRLGGSNIFTRSLVTAQFVLSIGLIGSTIIILQQVNYMQTKNPGFNKENVITVDANGTDSKKIYPLFKQQLDRQPLVKAIAGSELGLGANMGWSRSGFDYEGTLKSVYEYYVDADYIPLMGMQLLTGRNFDPKITNDTITSVIINEAMMRDFGWTMESVIGQKLKGYSDNFTPEVIGVIKDFNFISLEHPIDPQMFHQFADYIPFQYFVRIQAGNPEKAIASIQNAWEEIVPDLPFKYNFLDESLARFYASEKRWSNIVGWAGGISIFLACLGLLGLAALAAINRTKEIGIRKVLGASLRHILTLLSKDFLKLVAIALVIATPLAWYFMHNWLQDFAYRISISVWTFLTTGVVAIMIALVTISFQAIKTGIANPVKSLRTE